MQQASAARAKRRLVLGILAGEPSGDALGAGLMRALREQTANDVEFIGVGGSAMQAQGLELLHPMHTLTMHGFSEPIRRLPNLLGLLRSLTETMVERRVDAFVGVDFNVFNLLLERRLKRRGVPTIHYVSPSVYAWRRGRTRRVARAADRLLALFPFEPPLYAGTGLDVVYVGHPMADRFPLDESSQARANARQGLDLTGEPVVAVLPGSRRSEVEQMGALFVATGERLTREWPSAQFVIPCARPELRPVLDALLEDLPSFQWRIYDGDATQALTACDVALVKSGTSTLECMLVRRPMVVSYRLGTWTYRIVRRMLRTRFVALPNILHGSQLVPELLQHDATPSALAAALRAVHHRFYDDRGDGRGVRDTFRSLHAQLQCNADDRAASAVLDLVSATVDGC